jgi:uncharacterized Fe-S cluster-containing MiaB family protein
MDFDIKKPTNLAEQIDKMIHSFRSQNYGKYPERIVISYNTFNVLLDEIGHALFNKVNYQPPYKFCGIKIVRTVDIDNDTIELY